MTRLETTLADSGTDALYAQYLDSHPGLDASASEADYQKAAVDYADVYERFLPDARGAPAVDLGCGQGFFLYFLKSRGFAQAVGLDISPQQAEFARRIGLDARCGDARELLPRPGHYGFVSMLDVLEHIPKSQVVPLLGDIHASLRPGGRCLVTVPNMENPFNLNTRYGDFTHEGGFTSGSLTQVLRLAGFTNIEVRPVAGEHTERLYQKLFRRGVAFVLRRLYEIPHTPQGAHKAILWSRRIFAIAIKD